MRNILLLSVLLACGNLAKGQWNGKTNENNGVNTASTSVVKSSLVSVTVTDGSTYVAWIDGRNTSTGNDIFLQKLNADGSIAWAADGITVCNAINAQNNLVMVADGQGGVVLAWQDARDTNSGIYGQRINAAGQALWAANGVRLSIDNTVAKVSPIIQLVSPVSLMVAFRDSRSGTQDIFVNKIALSDGSSVWTKETDVHGNQANTQTAYKMESDGNNGVFIVWADPRSSTSTSKIYGQRIDSLGAVKWGSSGLQISGNNASGNATTPQLVSDLQGGIIVTWSDTRVSATDANIYAQRVNGDGVLQWNADAIVCAATGSQLNPLLVVAGSRFVISWSDLRISTDRNIYAQQMNGAGTLLLTANGLPICMETGNQAASGTEMAMVGLSDGSAVITWADPRISINDYNIYAQKLTNDGNIAWTINGVLISNAANSQRNPLVTATSTNETIMVWSDSRTNNTLSEIYASKVKAEGVLPVRFTQLSAQLSTSGSVQLKWSVAEQKDILAYEIYQSVEGEAAVKIASIAASAATVYQYTQNSALVGKVYYQVKVIDADGSITLSPLTSLNIPVANAGVTVSPLPAITQLNVQLNAASSGIYHLQVWSILGKLVLQQQALVDQSANSIQLDISTLSAGLYVLKLQYPDGSLYTQKILKQ